MRARLWVFAAMGVFVLALIAFNQWRPRQTAPAAATDKPSVAVLYFENNTGNPQLDWLRTGLTDMMVTDLSQSPDVEVLGTDRLVQILTSMKRQDDRVVSFDTVQNRETAGVKSVLLGSYMKSGDTIRINIKLQEATTGRILTSERVEAMGESNLFPTVDDLTRRVKAILDIPRRRSDQGLLVSPASNTTARSAFDRDLIDVTTTSIEAYRYYAEGINLHERGREEDAIPLLEKAVEIDPSFAMALGKLAVVQGNRCTSANPWSSQSAHSSTSIGSPRERTTSRVSTTAGTMRQSKRLTPTRRSSTCTPTTPRRGTISRTFTTASNA